MDTGHPGEALSGIDHLIDQLSSTLAYTLSAEEEKAWGRIIKDYAFSDSGDSRLHDALSHQALQHLFNCLSEPIVLISCSDWRVIASNDAYLNRLRKRNPKLDLESPNGKTLLDLAQAAHVVGDDVSFYTDWVREVIVTKRAVRRSEEDHYGTTPVYYSSTLTPIFRDGKVDCIAYLARDITHERRITERLSLSQHQLREAQRLAKAGNWTYRLDNGHVHWSNQLYVLYGLEIGTPVDVDTFLKYVHEDDRQEMIDLIQLGMQTGESWEKELRIMNAHGQLKYLHCRGEAIRDAKGEITHLTGVCHDLTETRASQLAVKRRDIHLKQSQRNGRIGYFTYNATTDEVLLSDEFARFWNVESKLRLQRMTEVVSVQDRIRVLRIINALRTGQNYAEFKVSVYLNGRSRYFELHIERLQSRTSTDLLFAGTIVDNTEATRRNRELETANQGLSLAKQKLEELAFVASHDLKSPILNIEALVEMVRDEGHNSEMRSSLLDKITLSVERMSSTLRNLNHVLEQSTIEFDDVQTIDMNELLEKVMLPLSEELSTSGGKVLTDFSALNKVRFSKYQLESVLLNLLTNALKYRNTEVPLQIQISTERVNEQALLKVEDNGIGIDLEKNRDRLFKLFKRFHDHVEGRGIGLHLVHSFVAGAGGRIDVDSEVGKGSTFFVYLGPESC